MKSVFDCSLFISANVTGQVGSLAVCPCAADAMSLLGDSEHLWHEYFDLSCLKGQFFDACRCEQYKHIGSSAFFGH